jgi:hypothetical protein
VRASVCGQACSWAGSWRSRVAKDAVLELLALTFEAGEPPGGVIYFTFADGGDLAATVECIDVALADLSQPWPTAHTPGHQT